MLPSSKVESLAYRFAPYTEELHELFRSRGVPFGQPADLAGFLDRLSEPSFHDEMGSMVRSVLYRESEAASRADLAEVIAVAVTGVPVDELAGNLHGALRRILSFVTDVVRPHPLEVATTEEAPDQDDRVEAVAAALPAEPLHLHIPESAAGVPVQAARASLPRTESQPQPERQTNDRLARALIDSGEKTGGPSASRAEVLTAGQGAEQAQEAAGFSAAALPRGPRPTSPTSPRPATRDRGLAAFLRHAYWIPGVCVLLLVLGAATLLGNHPRRQSPAPAMTPQSAVTPAPRPKPSAYGPSLAEQTGSEGQQPVSPPEQPPVVGPVSEARPGRTGAFSQPDLSATSGQPGTSPSGPTRRIEPHAALASARVTPRVLGGREGVFLASSGTMASHLLNAPAPGYPRLASLAHVQGEVIVQVVVARDGHVEATRALEGPRLLRGAAEHAIQHWQYRPYVLDGRPTDVATIVTVNFRLSR